MTVILAALTGYAGGRMLWLAMRKSWSRHAFMRSNFQGTSLPTAAGVVLALTLLVVEAARAVVASAGIGDAPGLTSERAAAFVVVLGFTFLGLLDDLVGGSGARGFNGHFQAMARGELTSGMIKLVGGAAIALVGASLIGEPSFGELLVHAGIIALAANLFNLLDVRPGRSTKTGLLLFALLVLTSGFSAGLVPVAIVLGATAATLLDDLHERLMLGDTGANALGAALGLGLITQVDGSAAVVTLLVLLGLNVLSEFVSFSKIIDTVPPLRIFDQLGRRRSPVIDLRDDAFAVDMSDGDDDQQMYTGPIPRRGPDRGNVGGARDGDRADAQALRNERSYETDSGDPLGETERDELFAGSDDELFRDDAPSPRFGREFDENGRPVGTPSDHRHN